MPQPKWSEVDAYFNDRLKLSDPSLEAVLKANAAAGLPAIDVSAAQGKFLHLLWFAHPAFSRLGRSAATARSGSRAPCRRRAGS
jgi:predicted O-methyltransferase YrrM